MSRRVWIVLGIVVAVVAALIVVGTQVDQPHEEALRKVGAPASEVCQPVTHHPPSGASDHVSPPVTYDRTPPNSGPHMGSWVIVNQRRFDATDARAVEQVVHNLEHGWVVLWYDTALADVAMLDRALEAAETRKLVAMPWVGTERLPTPYVLTAWGHEQRCTGVSGEGIADFLQAYAGRAGDAPEPDAP